MMATPKKTKANQQSQQQAAIPHRRAFTYDHPPLNPVYTHLSPIILSHPSSASNTPYALLLTSSSTAYYHPLSVTGATPPRSITTSPLSLDDDEDEEEDLVTAICATPSCEKAILAHRSGNLKIYSLPPSEDEPAPRTIRPFANHNVVAYIAVHPAGDYIAVGAADGTIRVLNIHNLSVTHTFNAPNGITVIIFAPGLQSTALVAGCDDGSICVFDLEQSQTRKKKKGKNKKSGGNKVCQPHVARVTGIVFVSNTTMVTSALDHVISVIDLDKDDENELKPRLLNVGAPVNAITTIKEEVESVGGKVLIASPGRQLRVWDINHGIEDTSAQLNLPFIRGAEKSELKKTDEDSEEEEEEVDISVSYMNSHISDDKNTTEIVIALSDSTILRARAESIGKKKMKVHLLSSAICGYLEEVYDVGVVPSSSDLQIAIASNSPIIWMLSPSENRGWRCVSGLRGHTANILSVSISGNLLASASRDATIKVWRKDSKGKWACVGVAEGHAEAVSAVAIAPRRKKSMNNDLIMASGGSDRTLKVWRLKSILKMDEKENESDADAELDDKDDDYCDIVDLWQAPDKSNSFEKLNAKWTVLAHEKDVNAVAVSPDGSIVATGSQDKSIKLWNADKGKLLQVMKGHKRGIWSIAFSDVDRVVASASGDGSVKVWSAQNGTCLRTMQGHTSGVVRVRFLSRGTQLVSGGADGVMKVWSVKSGECDASVEVGRDRVWALDVVDEGDKVISGDGNGRVIIWEDGSEKQQEERRMKRELESKVEQAVENAERVGKWGVAVKGALKLSMKEKIKRILIKLIENVDDVEADMRTLVREVWSNDKSEDKREGWKRVGELVMCCREWQAVGGSKNAVVASYLLQAILSLWTVEELTAGVLKLGKISEGRAVVEGLDVHCGRHVERVNRLVEKVAVMEHVLVMMRGGVHVENNDVEMETSSEETDSGNMTDADKKTKVPEEKLEEQVGTKAEIMERKRKRREELDCDY